MRAVVQRVSEASVTVEGRAISEIEQGYLVLLGVTHEDGEREISYLANKIAHLRVFEDAAGRMNLALADIDGSVLVVSQFTLFGDARKGRRPGFTQAAPPSVAEPLVAKFADALRAEGLKVAEGKFRAHMQVRLCNDGPVTMILDTEQMMRRA
jgi:D-tyrosyl-tRNA(Tyr) deacylase